MTDKEKRDEEMRIFKCRGWIVRSPRFDKDAAESNAMTKQWEAVITFSKPMSYAWVLERFPRCSAEPLFVSDMRRGATKVKKHREKIDALEDSRAKKSYTPTEEEI